ncbi:MAG: DUF1819 domain-containing protein [Deltaproteobacteria bacterium]|jgi:hypothetical protein|nr:DUF1819 domain-containing protein [Deltaproteobacteria bacterium]
MTDRPREATEVHTRLLKCALEVEDSRAFWSHADTTTDATAQQAFDEYWFGARSLARIEVLLTNLRARFGAFPAALDVLHRWPHMSPDTRRTVCHWHLQLADPLYRRFTGTYLIARRASPRPEVTRDLVVGWVGQQGPGRWTMSTRIQFASKLLSAAYSAGLVTSNRDPRPLAVPRVPDEALEYLMYLLRETTFEGSLLDNPYTSSLGLDGSLLEDRLRTLPGLCFKRQGDLIDFGWRHKALQTWANVNLGSGEPRLAVGAT